MSQIKASRYHDISCGHRVHNHESKCQHLHGHNYRIHFDVVGELDDVGRVLDFGVIKSKLCMWLEHEWDHKFLAWEEDPVMCGMLDALHTGIETSHACMISGSIVWVPFNPTAENMAQYLLETIGPAQLEGTGCALVKVTVEETMKCAASAERTGSAVAFVV